MTEAVTASAALISLTVVLATELAQMAIFMTIATVVAVALILFVAFGQICRVVRRRRIRR